MKTNSYGRIGLIFFISMYIGFNALAQTGQKITDSNCQPYHPCLLGDKFFYMGKTNQTGFEPWACYKNGNGAYLIKDIKPGAASGMDQVNSNNSAGYRILNGNCYFFADDGINGMELWKTDGTANGTVMVKDIKTGAGGYSGQFTSESPLNGNIIFYANDGTGFDLWKTDGTTEGTIKISNLKLAVIPYIVSSITKKTFVVLNNKMFFFINQALQVLDGVTFTLSSLESNGSWTPVNPLIPFQNQLYFFRQTGNIVSLWRTDGTLNNTTLIKNNLYTAVYNGNTYVPIRSAVNSNCMYIEMKLTTKGTYFTSELWKSDGTDVGTELIMAFNSQLNDMLCIKDKLYFSAFLDNLNNGIWVSDGSAVNTTLLYSFGLTTYTSFGGTATWSSSFNNLNDSLIFYKNLGYGDKSVFLTNGTSNGTNKILDLTFVQNIFVDSTVAYVYNGYDIYRYPTCNTTGIREIADDNGVCIYPNPASDFVKIDSTDDLEVNIYSLTGSKLVAFHNQRVISLKEFQAGIYFVSIDTGNKSIIRKIIKK